MKVLVYCIMLLLFTSCSSGKIEDHNDQIIEKIEIRDSIFIDSIRIQTH